jgi:glycosyltransferase involved in cell wall biosynthesis
MKLSIIVPVYNVEPYIRPCLKSLFKQELDEQDFEVILVNDGTQDNSFEKIEDLVHEHRNVMRINQENQGLSGARNTGMKFATGDYILFVDSDDLIVERSLSKLLPIAIDTSADLVVADFLKLSDDEILAYHSDLSLVCDYIEKTGSELFLEDLDHSQNYVWRTLYRREFLEKNNLKFIHGICYEDMPFTPMCYLKAKKCVRAYCDLYLYRMGHFSITSTMSTKKALDLNKVVESLWQLKDMDGLTLVERQRLIDNIFSTFSFELWCISHNKNVLDNRREIVKDLKKRVPDLWFSNGMKQIVVSLVFRLFPNAYLKLRAL